MKAGQDLADKAVTMKETLDELFTLIGKSGEKLEDFTKHIRDEFDVDLMAPKLEFGVIVPFVADDCDLDSHRA